MSLFFKDLSELQYLIVQWSSASIGQQEIYRDKGNSGHMQSDALLPAVINLESSGAGGGRPDD